MLGHLLELARSLGHYDGRLLPHPVTEGSLCGALSRGHPLLVAIDVDVWSGDPVEAGGTQGHIVVLVGWYRKDGVTWFSVRHPQANSSQHNGGGVRANASSVGSGDAAGGREWTAEALLGSMTQVSDAA